MAIWGRMMAAVDAFRDYGAEPVVAEDGRYADRWSWFAGTWRNDPHVIVGGREQPRLYKNTRQLWRTADAVVSLYEQFVYTGDLPTPPGTNDNGDMDAFRQAVAASAIPWEPQTGKPADDDALLIAFAELATLWRWRQHMALRPKLGAVLGDVLTEVVDDQEHGAVWPRVVWPGYVVDLDLNDVGDVKRYALEYGVTIPESTAYGQTVKAESYRFRKEVDSRAFRFYKDGKPFDYPEIGPAVQPNPYGFVPAIWDRHEIVFGDRGMGALDKTLAMAKEINSLLANALDYQQKQFNAPVGVKGAAVQNSLRRSLGSILPRTAEADPRDDPATIAARTAETLGLLPMNADGDFVTIAFDVGKTAEMVNLLIDSVVAESPEARYGQRLLELSQATGPAVELILAPITGKVKRARANYDPQTVKLYQMGTSMLGMRLAAGNYDRDLLARRPSRYAAFAPFAPGAFDAGRMDCGIADRDVFAESDADKIARLVMIEQLESQVMLRMAGIGDAEVAEIIADREGRRREMIDAAMPPVVLPDAEQPTGGDDGE